MLIALERGHLDPYELIADSDDVAIPAVAVAELLAGLHLAGGTHGPRRKAFIDGLLTQFLVEDYDLDVARAHGALLAHAHRSGRPRGTYDLEIAATALARQRIVLAADRPGFSDLPGVAVRDIART